MGTEAIGGVSVIIGGDYSKLAADFGNAQNLARAAGQATATAFGSGSGLVDQFGRSVSATAGSINQAAVSLADFQRVMAEENAALSLAIQRNAAVQSSMRGFGNASHEAGLNLRYLIFGIKDLTEGRLNFAMAEGVNILQKFGVAFALVGVAAIVAFSVIKKSVDDLKKAEQELQTETDNTDKAFEKQATAIEHLYVEMQTLEFGAAAGKKLQAAFTGDEIGRTGDKVKALNGEIAELERQAAGFHLTDLVPVVGSNSRKVEQADIAKRQEQQAQLQLQIDELKARRELEVQQAQKDTAEQAGALLAARIQNEEHANARATEIAKARITGTTALEHDAIAQTIAGLDSEYARVVATGQEEARLARQKKADADAFALGTRDTSISDIGRRFNAEAQGKTPDERSKLEVTAQGEIQAARDAYTKATVDSQNTVDAAVQKGALAVIELNQKVAQSLKSLTSEGWDQMTAAAKRAAEAGNANASKDALEKAAVLEVNARTAGVTAAANDQIKAAQLKAGYEAQSSHTLAEELAYMQQMADLEDKRYADQIKGLEAEREIAKALDDEEDRSRKVAQIEEQIARLKGQRGAAAFEAQGAQNRVSAQQSLGAKLGADGQAGVANLSQSLAKGIMDGGKGLGKDIRQSLSNIGKQMLGDVIEKSVESMVIAITGNTIATNLNTIATHALEIIETVKAFLGFADGTDSAPGGWSWVGEKGPELMNVPRGAQIVPNHKLPGYADGVGMSVRGGDTHHTTIQIYGVRDARQMARELPQYLKSTSYGFSPASK